MMEKIKKIKNIFQVTDQITGKQKTDVDNNVLKPIDYETFEVSYTKKGDMDYLIFKTQQEKKKTVRVLRLFRVIGVSSEIREEINNVEAFQDILNNFFDEQSSLIVLYAGEPAKSVIVSYGVLMEGSERELDTLIYQSNYRIKTLEKQFRAVYNAIDIVPFTQNESWVFDKFYYEYATYVRGIPASDESRGIRTGTSYDSPTQLGRQVSEVLLRGMASKISEDKVAVGESFLMYAMLHPLLKEEIQAGLDLLQNELGKTDSSSQTSLSDNENYSLPLMFGYGFGEMFGHSEVTTTGDTQGQTITEGTNETRSVSTSETNTEGDSTTNTAGENFQKSVSDGVNKGSSKGVNGGAGFFGGSYNEQDGTTKTLGETEGTTVTEAKQVSNSIAKSSGEVDAKGTTNTTANSLATTKSSALGDSKQSGNNHNAVGGVTVGDGSGVNRQIKDHFQQFATEIMKLNERRYQYGKRVGMFDFHMVVLTENEEGKNAAEALIKQSYTDKESPIPIRIIEPKTNQAKKVLIKYAKSMTKPFILEKRRGLAEKNGLSTHITPLEATAFSLPQDNFYGYDSSYDPIPPSITHLGEMKEGAKIGKQWDRHLNMLSSHDYVFTKEKLRGHIGIFGGTGQGKTVFAQKFISEIHNRYGINFILFDWTKNHRSLVTHINNPTHFRFSSFKSGLFPLRVNLLVPPKGVPTYVWDPIISELFCYSTGLGGRSYLIIIDCLNALHKRFEHSKEEPTILDLIDQVQMELESRTEMAGGRLGFKEQETFSSMRDRFKIWTLKNRPSFEAFCQGPFMPIDRMIEGEFVHLIECAHLPKDARKFVINSIAAGIFQYCQARDEKLPKPMYMMFEEAHTVLGEPTGEEPLPIDETIFEIMSREARNYELYIGYVCQSPEKLQDIIFDNMPIRVAFQLSDESGKSRLVSAAGRDPNRLDVDLVKWLSMQPRGMCLIRTSNFDKLQEGQFVAVKVDMLPSGEMSDDFFRTLLNKKMKKTQS